jgi:hypothetical protein
MLLSSLHLAAFPFEPYVAAFPFEPYVAKQFRSDVKHPKKQKTPEGIYTYWEIKSSSKLKNMVPWCAPCGQFNAEKAIIPRLSKLETNRDAFRAYHCDTLWKHSDHTPDNSNFVSTQTSEHPPK